MRLHCWSWQNFAGLRTWVRCQERTSGSRRFAPVRALLGLLLLTPLAISLLSCSSQPANETAERRPVAPTAPSSMPSEPSTPAPRATPQPRQSPGAIALAEARKKSREEQKEFIRDSILDGIFKQIELHQGIPRVGIRPGFRLLTAQDQQLYAAMVYAYAYPTGKGDKVLLLDGDSGKLVGTFTETGLQLE